MRRSIFTVLPRPIDLPFDPARALARWPDARPLAATWADPQGPGRWTILASSRRTLTEAEARERLARPLPDAVAPGDPDLPAFRGGLIGWVAYDLGREFEPRAGVRPLAPGPRMCWADCPDALIYDTLRRRWWGVGDAEPLAAALVASPDPSPASFAARFQVGPLRSRAGRAAYVRAVERAIEYIRAGDVYQVNLAHRLEAPFAGCPRAFWRALLAAARPWHGCYVESDDRALVVASASPELFLAFDPSTRRLATRPMKGTRPARAGALADLDASPKDRAELAMIVDLMRNDLGRVCELGSIRVERPRDLERHASLLQATATISGTLPPGRTPLDVLRAAFPCGSITGAPKVRAMQIIDELEPVPRGPYCGLCGVLSDHGAFAWSVAIRTAIIHGSGTPDPAPARLHYSVGAGIVADSDPAGEWRETLAKASVLRTAIRQAGPSRPSAVSPHQHITT